MAAFSNRKYLIAATIVGILGAQMPAVLAASTEKAGAICKTIGLRQLSKTGQKLLCSKNGKKLLWKIVPVATKRPTAPKPATSPSKSPSPSITPSAFPSPTSSTINSVGLSADCISMLVNFGQSMDSGSSGQSTDSNGAASNFQALGNCITDTGTTAIITSSPFNPADIASITKFRSCAGHDFAEGSADGQVLSNDPQYEKFSSMKHYIVPLKQNAGDTTDVFAPFDGVVTRIASESGAQSNGKTYANPGSQIDIVPYSNPSITFTFMHVYGTTLKPGDSVTSGQKLAHHEIQAVNAGHSSFDIAMSKMTMATMQAHVRKRLSMMNFLTQNVATELNAVGLTPDNLIWPAAYRTAHPCILTGSQGFFQGPQSPADSVTLQH